MSLRIKCQNGRISESHDSPEAHGYILSKSNGKNNNTAGDLKADRHDELIIMQRAKSVIENTTASRYISSISVPRSLSQHD